MFLDLDIPWISVRYWAGSKDLFLLHDCMGVNGGGQEYDRKECFCFENVAQSK